MDGERRFTRENKDKNPWFYTSRSYGGDFISAGLLGGFSWPPRSYTCSFCRREFRSAQALGGHMNVHRRERARLRQSPPWEGQPSNPNPNPNPTLPSNSPLANASTPITYNFPSLTSSSLTCVSSSSPSSSSPFKERKLPLLDPPVSSTSTKGHDTHLSRGNTKKALFGAGDLNKLGESGEEKKRIQGDAALDLDIGLSTEGITDPIEELDLELRLGYA